MSDNVAITAGSGTTIATENLGGIHYQQVIVRPEASRIVTTRLWFHSGQLVVGASADASNVGRVYVENDPDSTVLLAVPWVRFSSQLASALAAPTAPRFVLRFFTFTGNTPSGATISGAEQDTSYAAKNGNWDVRTAATGMTITEGATIASFHVTASATAVGYAPASVAEWRPQPGRPLILRAGEGLMLKQADAGTTSDTRVVTCDFEVEECSAV